MKYTKFIIAAILATIFLSSSHAQDESLTQSLADCKPASGAILVSPEPPRKVIAKLCSSELKRLDCQILFHLRNYIFYSYGRCMNDNLTFGLFVNRPICSQIPDRAAYNATIDKTIPDEVWPFIFAISKVEAEKGCLPSVVNPY